MSRSSFLEPQALAVPISEKFEIHCLRSELSIYLLKSSLAWPIIFRSLFQGQNYDFGNRSKKTKQNRFPFSPGSGQKGLMMCRASVIGQGMTIKNS